MKMTPEAFNRLSSLVSEFDTAQRREKYRKGEFPRADKVKDLNMRYRWDLWWSFPTELRQQIIDSFGSYPADSYIDTGLRRAVAPL